MSVNCIDLEDGSARGVLGQKLTLVECPTELKGFMMELGSIGQTEREREEENSETVVHLLSVGTTEIPTPRLDRIRWMLEKGRTRDCILYTLLALALISMKTHSSELALARYSNVPKSYTRAF
ncbi:hypothetical protein JAAARDRAFT_530873 [Jaapia argillacea MUCL 33604]|uniref:Uncharacterized protein n=1 Tax=Jaapia argillacea MUCL 33604 TaxID=933084 RepID=A0A067P9B6_9AGAM|nr:hypothetical protein JAAARDRAFT_530873 [Jaapia argillacea MUCL 33604]